MTPLGYQVPGFQHLLYRQDWGGLIVWACRGRCCGTTHPPAGAEEPGEQLTLL